MDSRILVIEIGSRLDFRNAETFATIFRGTFARGDPPRIVLDFTGTEWLDSVGLGAVLTLFRKLRTVEGNLTIAGASGAVEEVFRLSRVDRSIAFYPSLSQALDALQ